MSDRPSTVELRSFDFAPALIASLEGKFPRTCSSCGHVFESLQEYTEVTTPVGTPQDLDVGRRISDPDPPFGVVCYANCPCGSTLAVSCDLPAGARRALRLAIEPDAQTMNWRTSQVWAALRSHIHELVRRKRER